MAALYALALQALLGQAAFVGGFGPAHILCSPEAGDADGSSKHPAHAHLPCCPAAHAVAAPVLPPTAATAVVWPAPQHHRVSWRPEVTASPRAPPGTRPRVRAPPVA
ncbi:hypothetical protein [Methylobacterium sp. Leaf456]|uniref:hypothetical protein n=1 Tax=Methylobacterium sp. Leaf456 TaxID=1736382 RepID=UPI00256FC36E|nr:hypothetical protein [Methylobacterium sp. Leaf456]